MKANEDKNMKASVMLERNRSTVSTAIMENTEVSRHKRWMRSKEYGSKSIDLRVAQNHSSSNKTSKTSSSKKKEPASLLDRLTIVGVEASSSKKNDRPLPRNNIPLPEELLLRDGQQDNVSMIPDGFSNTHAFSKDDEMDINLAVHDDVPALFTFDLVPSISEDSSCKNNGGETEGEHSIGNDTTDANIGEEDDEDDISRMFYGFEENDAKPAKEMEEKYCARKSDTASSMMNKVSETNRKTLDALSKLELITRTRTESTAFLSEASSNDTSLQLKKKPTKIFGPSKFDQNAQEERSLVAKVDKKVQKERNLATSEEFQLKASRCISFNMFSLFD